MSRGPPPSTLFPYTTLFRSRLPKTLQRERAGRRERAARRATKDQADDHHGDHWGRVHHFREDRKSTRLNSSHLVISYAVFCLKKKKQPNAARTCAQQSAPAE